MTTDECYAGVDLRAECRALRQQLADCQTNNLRLRDALNRLSNCKPYETLFIIHKALATPPGDLSVLREVIADCIEEHECAPKGHYDDFRRGEWTFKVLK